MQLVVVPRAAPLRMYMYICLLGRRACWAEAHSLLRDGLSSGNCPQAGYYDLDSGG